MDTAGSTLESTIGRASSASTTDRTLGAADLALRKMPANPNSSRPRLTPTETLVRSRAATTQPTFNGPSPEVGTFRIVGLRKWDGRVIEVDAPYFTAELVPTDGTSPTVIAEFDLDQLSPSDAEQVAPGTLFYLTVRTVSDRGHRERTSSVRLRRLGKWTDQDTATVAAGVERLRNDLADLWE